MIEGSENLMKYITDFYKNLFGQSDSFLCTIEIDDIPQLDAHDRDFLIQDFTLEELHDAVFSMEVNKSPGPDGFLVEFYQYFWLLVKDDLKGLLDGFFFLGQ